ncbi:hypothetical protein DMENIID0001_059590 [Sergentomyia squamirostris]
MFNRRLFRKFLNFIQTTLVRVFLYFFRDLVVQRINLEEEQEMKVNELVRQRVNTKNVKDIYDLDKFMRRSRVRLDMFKDCPSENIAQYFRFMGFDLCYGADIDVWIRTTMKDVSPEDLYNFLSDVIHLYTVIRNYTFKNTRLDRRFYQWHKNSTIQDEQYSSVLKGKALAVLANLPEESRYEWDKVVQALKIRFGREHLQDLAHVEFKSRRQQAKEELVSFAGELRRLVRMAYPECPIEALDGWLDGLMDGLEAPVATAIPVDMQATQDHRPGWQRDLLVNP